MYSKEQKVTIQVPSSETASATALLLMSEVNYRRTGAHLEGLRPLYY